MRAHILLMALQLTAQPILVERHAQHGGSHGARQWHITTSEAPADILRYHSGRAPCRRVTAELMLPKLPVLGQLCANWDRKAVKAGSAERLCAS